MATDGYTGAHTTPVADTAMILQNLKKRAGDDSNTISKAKLIEIMNEDGLYWDDESFDGLLQYGKVDADGNQIQLERFVEAIFLVSPAELATNFVGTTAVNTVRRKRLRDMKVFVLDNSLRESTVGAVRGHTIEDKQTIYEQVKACKFKHIIVGAFSTQARVDDAFVKNLCDNNRSEINLYAFSEDADAVDENGCMKWGRDHIPIALQKMKTLGVPNPIIEVDFADKSVKWKDSGGTFDLMELLRFLLEWSKEELSSESKCFINIRDFPIAMLHCPQRVLHYVQELARLPRKIRPMGMLIEEPMGIYFPDEVGRWTRAVRMVMDGNDWRSDGETTGLLLGHVHKQWGMADAVVLEMLAEGANGVWCSLCEEGASSGHACSTVTLANLARLGNKDVMKYETKKLGEGARAVTRVTTGNPVAPRQIVYGPRAVEAVFDFGGIAGSTGVNTIDIDDDGKVDEMDRFKLAEFLGVDEPPIRITTLSSARMIAKRLKQLFGDDETFTEELALKMKEEIQNDLRDNRKEEYTSVHGLSKLYQQVTQNLTKTMEVELAKQGDLVMKEAAWKPLLIKSKEIFYSFMPQAEDAGAESAEDIQKLDDNKVILDYKCFFEKFLQPHFGCYSCERTQDLINHACLLDTNHDSHISYAEWEGWLVWAIQEYPNEITGEDTKQRVECLNDLVIRKAILPNFLKRHTGGNTTSEDDV